MSNFIIQLLATIGSLLTVGVTFYLGVANLRKQNKNIVDKIEGVSVAVVGVSWDVKDMKFEREIINSLKGETSKIIGYSKSLEQIFKDSMSFICDHLTQIITNYYYSPARKSKSDIEQQLVCDINAFKRELFSYLSHILPNKKHYTYSTGHKEQVNFSAFIKDSNIKDRLELLIVRLTENGYTADKQDIFINDMRNFLNKFFDRYVELIMQWKALDNEKPNN